MPLTGAPRKIIAEQDPGLSARVVSSRPLLYGGGADPAHDRPPHVRAGSSLVFAGTRLAVVQDDALFVALVDPAGGGVEALALPTASDGRRCFDDGRGNKEAKPDLEACLMSDGDLLAFGSGSSPARERVYRVKGIAGRDPSLEVIRARRLYARLRAEEAFAGSELNLEGAVLMGGRVRLLQRGNGAARGRLRPQDATGELDLARLLVYLDSGDSAEPPAIRDVVQYDLGALGGVRLGFTDGAALGGRLLYLAAAEDSPDAVRDGPVAGVAVGIVDADAGRARWTGLRGRDGGLFRGKAEGLALDPREPGIAHLVVDRDDPGVPAELCRVELRGV